MRVRHEVCPLHADTLLALMETPHEYQVSCACSSRRRITGKVWRCFGSDRLPDALRRVRHPAVHLSGGGAMYQRLLRWSHGDPAASAACMGRMAGHATALPSRRSSSRDASSS